MRVLHVIPGIARGFGGPAQVCREMCRELAQLGLYVEIFTTDADINGAWLSVPKNRPIAEDGYRISFFHLHIWRYGLSLPMARMMSHRIREFDVVHIHSLYTFSTAFAAYVCRRDRVPYILRPHGTLDPFMRGRNSFLKGIYTKLIERKNLDSAAAIHYTTAEEMRLTADMRLHPIGIVIPNGIMASEYRNLPSPTALVNAHPALAGKRIILYLGRINFKKGFDILAKAFGIISREVPNVHLVIVGPDDGFGTQVREWLACEGVLDRTTFTGMLEGQDKLTAFAAAECFVLPSYTENF
ncbi:MAG: glycosyltransferase, partial [Candidatus Riflebacteria bacterium]|nr:glycosyltransferase [Candidatus Riflebacteria bacterium]